MAKVYKSAMGKQIDVDSILLTNENVIAVGNMKTNGRGDLLGPGGKIAKTRDQLMKEYYTLNTPVASDVLDQTPPTPAPSHQPVVKSAVVAVPPQQPGTAPLVFAPAPIINPESGLDENEPEIVKSPITVQPQPTAITADSYEPTVPAPVPAADQTPMVPVIPGPGTPSEMIPVDHHTHISEPGMPMAPATIIRGKMANALAAKPATVTQKEMLPPKKANGIQRF
jgi:hypothetical protein